MVALRYCLSMREQRRYHFAARNFINTDFFHRTAPLQEPRQVQADKLARGLIGISPGRHGFHVIFGAPFEVGFAVTGGKLFEPVGKPGFNGFAR